jgi:hypothetical protein
MRERRFVAAGGGIVTWTYTHDVANGQTPVGTYTCTGCRETSRPVQWPVANTHAERCRQIP